VYSLATGMMVHEFSVTRCSSAAGIATIHTLPNALSGGTLVLVPPLPWLTIRSWFVPSSATRRQPGGGLCLLGDV
jgi:hypothetical protein